MNAIHLSLGYPWTYLPEIQAPDFLPDDSKARPSFLHGVMKKIANPKLA
jgi:hypothetical protein